ncbi:FAS1-like dehydratase domain-containing protein [Rhodococcus sp. 27YEA15]|uniref:FAS1-like dehydratase domain-containing protein n=1 Tax=Rhodococcus sp. 27YEA15 TaxID=3156259 RepID=UPI003C7AAC1F
MPLNPDLEGRVFPPIGPYSVGREKVREFAYAVFGTDPIHFDVVAARAAGHADLVAPATFVAVVLERTGVQLMKDPDAGLDPTRIVHGSEKATFHRHIVAGDELTITLTVTNVTERGGNAILATSNEIHDVAGKLVVTVASTFFVRGESE